jgi:5'-nucleotidase
MLCARHLLTHTRRFPIVSGLQVVWDHTLPPNQRVKSIRLVNPPSNDDDDDDVDDDYLDEDMVDFVEQEDGTRIEVKQRKTEVGEEVKNEEGGRIYRIVSLLTVRIFRERRVSPSHNHDSLGEGS